MLKTIKILQTRCSLPSTLIIIPELTYLNDQYKIKIPFSKPLPSPETNFLTDHIILEFDSDFNDADI